jgi:hypothetical protein
MMAPPAAKADWHASAIVTIAIAGTSGHMTR